MVDFGSIKCPLLPLLGLYTPLLFTVRLVIATNCHGSQLLGSVDVFSHILSFCMYQEIRSSIECLNSNITPGDEEITSELLKHDTWPLDATIAGILNEACNKHQDLEINTGILITLTKPGNPKGPPQNLRPITELNTIRKILFTLTLNNIRQKVESFTFPSPKAVSLQNVAHQTLFGPINGWRQRQT